MTQKEADLSVVSQPLGYGARPLSDKPMGVYELGDGHSGLFFEGAVGDPADLGADERPVLSDITGGGGDRPPIDPSAKNASGDEAHDDGKKDILFSPADRPHVTITITNPHLIPAKVGTPIEVIEKKIDEDRRVCEQDLQDAVLTDYEREMLDEFQIAADLWLSELNRGQDEEIHPVHVRYVSREVLSPSQTLENFGGMEPLFGLAWARVGSYDFIPLMQAAREIIHEKIHSVKRADYSVDCTRLYAPDPFQVERMGLRYRDGNGIKGYGLDEAMVLAEEALFTRGVIDRFEPLAKQVVAVAEVIDSPEFMTILRAGNRLVDELPKDLLYPHLTPEGNGGPLLHFDPDNIDLVVLATFVSEIIGLRRLPDMPTLSREALLGKARNNGMHRLFSAGQAKTLGWFHRELHLAVGDELFDEIMELGIESTPKTIATLEKLYVVREQLLTGGASPLETFLKGEGYTINSLFAAVPAELHGEIEAIPDLLKHTEEYTLKKQLVEMLPVELLEEIMQRHRAIHFEGLLPAFGFQAKSLEEMGDIDLEKASLLETIIMAVIDSPSGPFASTVKKATQTLKTLDVAESVINRAVQVGLVARKRIASDLDQVINSFNPENPETLRNHNRWFGLFLGYRVALHNKAVRSGREQGKIAVYDDALIDVDRTMAAHALTQFFDDLNAIVPTQWINPYNPEVGINCVRNLHRRVTSDFEALRQYGTLSQRLDGFLDAIYQVVGSLDTRRTVAQWEADRIYELYMQTRSDVKQLIQTDLEVAGLWDYYRTAVAKIRTAISQKNNDNS